MITISMSLKAANLDADLVDATLAGNREAFAQIVARYQSLICSLAYSATGSLGQSEDLAQETFITAWKHLGHLRERDKLRSWLCGIARNRINNFLRREGREPVVRAESLEQAAGSLASGPVPVEATISKEEEAILWRALEQIPETYRVPLVLFYREHQSVETVAKKLDLTADAVHQRLSRGRKLLQGQVLALVAGALARSNPGRAFTLGVLAALPALTFSAKAAAAGATGGAAAKAAAASGWLAVLFTPLVIFLGSYAGYRMNLATVPTEEERHRVQAAYRSQLWLLLAFAAVFLGLINWACWRQADDRALVARWFPWLIAGALAVFLLVAGALAVRRRNRQHRYLTGVMARENLAEFAPTAWEYRSRARFLGLPLMHVRIGDRFAALRPPVKAWLAVGESAVGGLFAFGAVAVAPVCVGGLGLGLVSFSGLAVGGLALGGIAWGGWAVGGVAVGWQACGGFALAWNAAAAGVALAHDCALGGYAQALHANDALAGRLIHPSLFFQCAQVACDDSVAMNLIWAVPMLWWWRTVRQHRQPGQA